MANEDLNIISKDVSKLLFDPENPRLPSTIRGYNRDEDVIEWMILNENIIELMGSIGEKGYFQAEPLLVVESRKKKGYFEVIEGNRRLAALKLLSKPSSATFKKSSIKDVVAEANVIPEKVPVIVFPKKEEILVYLGYRHITGIKEWGPLAKAKYLEQLSKNLKIKNKAQEYKTLAKIIGSNSSYVRSILSGLRVYKILEENSFFDIPGLDEVTVEFGVLYTAVGRKNISAFVGISLDNDSKTKINLKHLKELTSWMFEKNSENFTRLGESRNIPDLDRVVNNSLALKYFRSGRPLSEAVLFTDKPSIVFSRSINDAVSSVRIARDQADHIDTMSSEMLNSIDEVIKVANNLRILINAKLNEDA